MERDYLIVGTDLSLDGTLHREGAVVRLETRLGDQFPAILRPVAPPAGTGPVPGPDPATTAPPAPAAETTTKRRKR